MTAPSSHMQAALAEARAALGTPSPSPAVGAVVVSEGEIIARGRTQPVGGPHAEVMALRAAGDRGRGARLGGNGRRLRSGSHGGTAGDRGNERDPENESKHRWALPGPS